MNSSKVYMYPISVLYSGTSTIPASPNMVQYNGLKDEKLGKLEATSEQSGQDLSNLTLSKISTLIFQRLIADNCTEC